MLKFRYPVSYMLQFLGGITCALAVYLCKTELVVPEYKLFINAISCNSVFIKVFGVIRHRKSKPTSASADQSLRSTICQMIGQECL